MACIAVAARLADASASAAIYAAPERRPNKLGGARSFQFGLTSAPIAPQTVHTMCDPNAGTGASSGQWLTSAYLAAFRLFRHGRKPGIGMLSIPALRQRAARG
jgi:hypothetical protein